MTQNPSLVATILLADYDVRSRRICAERLEQGEFLVVPAADGRQALDAALTLRPEIMSASIFLPTVGGVELCRRLKRDPRTARMQIILHSSSALLPEQCRQARDAGCDVLLLQPKMPDGLFNEATRIVGDAMPASQMSRLLRQLSDQYLERRNLRLTREQVRRVVGLSEPACAQFLDLLVRMGFLGRTPDDHYERAIAAK